MSDDDGHEPGAGPRNVVDVVCTSCACLCDDIELRIEGERIIEARNACAPAVERYLAYHAESAPACFVDGQPTATEIAVERAARILVDARYPFIFGLDETTSEAQRAAVSLAERVAACVDCTGVEGDTATMLALQSVGEVTCTLGEIKNRADLVIVWRADPIETHPRLFSRYALDPRGTFVPGGRGDRYCVVVDVNETRSAREAADQFIAIRAGAEFESLSVIRALVKGLALDDDAVESGTGASIETWAGLVDRMKAARYGALFYSPEATEARSSRPSAEALHRMTREMNAHARFVCMPLGGRGNIAGARNVLTWRTGYPFAVSLTGGFSRFEPGEATPNAILSRGEADAALIVSGDPVSRLTVEARRHLANIPSIALESAPVTSGFTPSVVFRTAWYGASAAGTVYRMDGVPLPLRPALPSLLPRDEAVLRAIEDRVGSLTAGRLRCLREGDPWP